jgi:hypothetical protein
MQQGHGFEVPNLLFSAKSERESTRKKGKEERKKLN